MASRAYNIPNLLTYGRILAVPLIVLCFFVEGKLSISNTARWVALWIFVIASITDFLDGYLARIWNQTSNIGRMLDPIADKLLLTTAFVSLWLVGELPLWLVGLIVARDLVIVAGAAAYHWLIGRFDAAPSRLSKLTTTLQIVFVLVELLHLSRWLPVPDAARAVLAAATALVTLASGLHYVVIWGARARRAKRTESSDG